MKKIIFILMLLLLVSPAWAKVEISCTADSSGEVTVRYDMSSGDANLPRAFGLNVTLDNDANIASAGNFNPSFWVHPGSIDINDNVEPAVIDSNGNPILDAAEYPQAGGLVGPPDSNGMTIEMGSLYEDGVDPAPDNNGVLFTFTVDASCNVTVAGNSALGKVVLEDTNQDNSLYTGCAVSIGPSWCYFDGDDDDDIDLDDYAAIKGKLQYAKYLIDSYLVTKDDATTGFLYDPRFDGDADDDIDLDDYAAIKGKLQYAKYLIDQYLVTKDDATTGFLYTCP